MRFAGRILWDDYYPANTAHILPTISYGESDHGKVIVISETKGDERGGDE